MSEKIIVSTQEELNAIPADFEGYVEVAFGNEINPAIIDHASRLAIFIITEATVAIAKGISQVYAFEHSKIIGCDYTQIVLYDYSSGEACDQCKILTFHHSEAVIRDHSDLKAFHYSKIIVHSHCRIVVYDPTVKVKKFSFGVFIRRIKCASLHHVSLYSSTGKRLRLLKESASREPWETTRSWSMIKVM